MKRVGCEVLSPVKPPRAVHGRLSQLDTQPDAAALDLRLSQADTVVAPTPDDPDPSGIPEQVQDSRWEANSFADPPLPDDAPGTPVVVQSPFSGLSASSYRGILPLPALAPVSGFTPSVQVANSGIFARARTSCRPVVSGPRAACVRVQGCACVFRC